MKKKTIQNATTMQEEEFHQAFCTQWLAPVIHNSTQLKCGYKLTWRRSLRGKSLSEDRRQSALPCPRFSDWDMPGGSSVAPRKCHNHNIALYSIWRFHTATIACMQGLFVSYFFSSFVATLLHAIRIVTWSFAACPRWQYNFDATNSTVQCQPSPITRVFVFPTGT